MKIKINKIFIQATLIDNFLSNNKLEIKFRKNLWHKLNFQNYYSIKFALGAETVQSKETNSKNEIIRHHTNSLVTFLQPEKSVFALTFDIEEKGHKFRPYLGQ